MRLRELLSKAIVKSLRETDKTQSSEITSLAYDSRSVIPGAAFFAIQGERADGHAFIPQAVAKGASTVVSERVVDPDCPVTWIQVEGIRRTMAQWADLFNGHPSKQLQLVGITGTNGKTTTAYLVHSIFQELGDSLLMGSIQTRIGENQIESTLTTPESVDIQKTLATAVDQGCRHGVMEVSSHALIQHRAYACRFPVGVFTNLSQDHLDYHGTLEEYFRAKALLFSTDYNPGLQTAVVNGDDPYGQILADRLGPNAVRFGFNNRFPVCPRGWSSTVEGTNFDLQLLDRTVEFQSRLIGKHNLYNIMAAAAACASLGLPTEAIQSGVAALPYVPGRFEKLEIDTPFTVVIDFAHTPDALNNVLCLAREVCRGRVICLFGAGGNRDRGKRPQMASIASRQSDYVIVTSDNPRNESPQTIIEEIIDGIPADSCPWEAIVDRREAIRHALHIAQPGDLLLLAGKGHETYQEVQGKKSPFDERQVVKEALCSR